MVELEAAKERIDLAQRKREISLENQELMAARVNGGFAGNGVISTLAMEAAQRESEAGLQMAAGHWRTMLYSLYVACGIHQHPESALEEINKAPEKISAAGEGQ